MAKRKIVHGSIVWAEVNNPDTGAPVGEHPVIVLSRQESIDAGKDLRVIVITTTYTRPVRDEDGRYEMPHTPGKPGGHEKTGLSEACVAKATWPQRVSQATVRIKGKHIAPASIVRKAQNWLDAKRAEAHRAQTRNAGEPDSQS